MFWRTIGFIVNQSNLPFASSKLKSQDYHFMLGLIFASVVEVQQGPGVAWNLSYEGAVYEVVFKFPVLFIVGDTEGHDKLCGKFLSRTERMARLCRYCDCPTAHTNDPSCTWDFTLAPSITSLVRDGEIEQLRSMSYHCIKNGFDDVVFCDPERGINGATPAEILHVWQHGLFPRALAALFGQKRALKSASRRPRKPKPPSKKVAARNSTKLRNQPQNVEDNEVEEEDSDENDSKPAARVNPSDELSEEGENEDDEGFDGGNRTDSDDEEAVEEDEEEDMEEIVEDVEEEVFELEEGGTGTLNPIESSNDDETNEAKRRSSNLSKNGVFTVKVCGEVDAHAKLYGRFLAHQSNREFARSFFPSGITTNAKKNGHEEKLVVLLMLIIFTSITGPNYDVLFDGPRPAAVDANVGEEDQVLPAVSIGYIELLTNLLLVEYFLKVRSITRGEIRMYEKYMPLFLNSYKQVVNRVAGMGMNFVKFHLPLHSAEDIERFGPSMSFDGSNGESGHIPMKQAGRNTQKNTRTFEAQTARQHTQNLMIDRACRQLKPPPSLLPVEAIVKRGVMQPGMFRGFSYYVTKDGMFVQQIYTKKTKDPVMAIWPDDALRKRVETLIVTQVVPFVPSGSVKLFTELKWTKAGTIFRANPSYGKDNKPWHDWAEIDWSQPGTIAEDDDFIPSRLVIYFQISEFDYSQLFGNVEPFQYFPLQGRGNYAVVECLAESIYKAPTTKYSKYAGDGEPEMSNYLAHPVCTIIYWSMMETLEGTRGGVPLLRIVPTLAICDTCVAVPFDITDEHSGEWLIIAPLKDWNESFLDEMTSRIEKEKLRLRQERAAAKRKRG